MLPNIDYGLNVATTPSVFPVATSDFKDHARIDSTDDDTYIAGLIGAATEYVEQQTNRRFVRQTWELRFDDFPYEYWYELPFGKLSTTVTIEYYDSDGSSQTLSSTKYWVDNKRLMGRVQLRNGESWPTVELDRPGAVITTFACGYTTSSTSRSGVPDSAAQAINYMASNLYENREPTSPIPSNNVALTIDSMINTIKIHEVR